MLLSRYTYLHTILLAVFNMWNFFALKLLTDFGKYFDWINSKEAAKFVYAYRETDTFLWKSLWKHFETLFWSKMTHSRRGRSLNLGRFVTRPQSHVYLNT
jgi:hypothetical protein